MSKWFLVAVLISLLAGLIGFGLAVGPDLGIEIRSLVDLNRDQFSTCGSKQVLLSELPVEINELKSISPLGDVEPDKGRVFPADRISLLTASVDGARDGFGNGGEVDVFVPGNSWLTKVIYTEYKDGEMTAGKDYALVFKPCSEVEFSFYHVKSLHPQLLARLDNNYEPLGRQAVGGLTQDVFEMATNIKVRAGEPIGRAGGVSEDQVLGFRMLDERAAPISYANPKRWDVDSQYVTCPLDYYEESQKKQLMELIGDGRVRRSRSPVCGTVGQDLKGTAQGAWFAEAAAGNVLEDGNLSLAHDSINPSKPVFSVGKSMEKSGLPAGAYNFDVKKDGVINRDFNDVNETGRIYCYQGLTNQWGDKIAKIIMLELADNDTIRLETRSSLSCVGIQWAFSDRMTVLER